MSHTTKCNLTVTNEAAVLRAAEVLQLRVRAGREHKLYDGTRVQGVAVDLPGWQYPAIFNTKTGTIYYDNYNGGWGQQLELDKFIQRYTVEALTEEAINKQYSIQQTVAENGDITMYCDVIA